MCITGVCIFLVLRYGKTLAEKVDHQTGVSKMINGLHRAYINIFAESSRDKHDPDFVFLSWVKVLHRFKPLFEQTEHLFFFTDGGSSSL